MKVIITMLLCAIGATAFGQMSKIEYTHHGDTTFIKYLWASKVYTTLPPGYGDYKVIKIDTIISNDVLPNGAVHPILIGHYMPGMPHEASPSDTPSYHIDNLEGVYHSDTLEIADTAIHFIKIGDKVFEIKRMVELVPKITLPKIRQDMTWRNAMPSVQLYNLQN